MDQYLGQENMAALVRWPLWGASTVGKSDNYFDGLAV